MTACTNHGGKARRVVTAALVGVLSVGTVPMVALATGANDGIEAQALVPALTELRRRDADFDPVIRMGPHSALVEMVEDGRLDVVLEYRDPSGAPAGA